MTQYPFKIYAVYIDSETYLGISECPLGKWVKVEDAIKLLEELKKANATISKLRAEIGYDYK